MAADTEGVMMRPGFHGGLWWSDIQIYFLQQTKNRPHFESRLICAFFYVQTSLLNLTTALMKMWLGYFQTPKSPAHIQLSASVDYAPQWQGGRARERSGAGNRRRAAAYVLCWYSVLKGRYESWEFFCARSGFTGWPLSAKCTKTHSHLPSHHHHIHTL